MKFLKTIIQRVRGLSVNKEDDQGLSDLADCLIEIPSISGYIGRGYFDNGNWWVKFSIDISHPLAWRVVQELGHVLNYISTQERLPTVFMPVSPPPYLNGGPKKYLAWVIESKLTKFSPRDCVKWLQGQLPKPIDNPKNWEINDE